MKMEQGVFREEQIRQEISANRYTLIGSYMVITLVLICWVLNQFGIFQVPAMPLTYAVGASIVLLIIPSVVKQFVTLDKPWFKYLCIVALCMCTAVLCGIMGYHATLVLVMPLLFSLQYMDRLFIWFTYFLNVILMAASTVWGFYYGICDLNILITTSQNRNYYIDQTTGELINLVPEQNPVFVILFYATVTRALILLLFTVVLRFIMKINIVNTERMISLKLDSEMDTTTRVFNKGRFNELVEIKYRDLELVACIFWDMNGLKETNDSLGHEAGDELIKAMADAVLAEADERRNVFRMGGDEFMMILENPADLEAMDVIASVAKRIDEINEQRDVKLSCACGFAQGAGADISAIVNMADMNMYKNKREMKTRRMHESGEL